MFEFRSTMCLQVHWNFRAQSLILGGESKSKSKGRAGAEPQPSVRRGMLYNRSIICPGGFQKHPLAIARNVEDAGHIFIHYPKLHCELNWIGHHWGRCKNFTREHCSYSLPGKQLELPTCTCPYSDRPSRGNLLTIPGFRIVESCSSGSWVS